MSLPPLNISIPSALSGDFRPFSAARETYLLAAERSRLRYFVPLSSLT